MEERKSNLKDRNKKLWNREQNFEEINKEFEKRQKIGGNIREK